MQKIPNSSQIEWPEPTRRRTQDESVPIRSKYSKVREWAGRASSTLYPLRSPLVITGDCETVR
jgi:hypothetical protein